MTRTTATGTRTPATAQTLRIALTAATAMLLVGGCGGHPGRVGSPPAAAPATSSTPTCIPPACIPPGHYTTTVFLGGQLKVTFDVTWKSDEDQTSEFSGAPPGTSDIHRLLFWMDILPTDAHGQVVTGVAHTASGLITWLSHRANLSVTPAHRTTIGAADWPAQVVDISISDDATNEDPGCPGTVCVQLLTWPNAGPNRYGFGEQGTLRLYLADVDYAGGRHLFAVAIEAKDKTELDAFAPTAQKVIASMTGPIHPA
jgi:hypothetical protein